MSASRARGQHKTNSRHQRRKVSMAYILLINNTRGGGKSSVSLEDARSLDSRVPLPQSGIGARSLGMTLGELVGGDGFSEEAKGLVVGGTGHAALGNDGSHVLGGGHVEGRIFHLHPFGCDGLAGNMRDFAGGALLDGNLAAVGRL